MTERLASALENDRLLVEKEIERIYSGFGDKDTDTVREAEMYSLTAGGKRIRPFLVIEFCRLFGGSVDAALPFAAAIEIMHTFSLIHDDLPCMDDDELRRGKPTSHVKFGEATALLAGDSLSLRALETVLGNDKVSLETARLAALALARAAGSEGMIGGQIIDMRGEKEALDFSTLLKLHAKKTGAIISVSAYLGCLAAGLPLSDPGFDSARNYSENVGLAFQIVDDILDATSDALTLGKNVGTDKKRNKTTFLSHMSLNAANEYAERLTKDAVEAIKNIPGSGVLCDLAEYLLTRKT